MVRGGGNGQPGIKMKLGVKEKIFKRGKKEENYIKKGRKGLKNTSFWAIKSNKFRFAPPAANLFVGEKMNLKRSKCTIYFPGLKSSLT